MTTMRVRAPVVRRARGMSTVAARKSLLQDPAREAREVERGASGCPDRRARSGWRSACAEAESPARARSCGRRTRRTDPDARTASVFAASFALSSSSARSRSATDIRSPGSQVDARLRRRRRRRPRRARRGPSGSSSIATSAVISFVAEAIARCSGAIAAVQHVAVAGVDDDRRPRRAVGGPLRRPRDAARRARTAIAVHAIRAQTGAAERSLDAALRAGCRLGARGAGRRPTRAASPADR